MSQLFKRIDDPICLVIKYCFGLAAGLCWFACIWVYFTGLVWTYFLPAPTVRQVPMRVNIRAQVLVGP
jgi:hypothetical protein